MVRFQTVRLSIMAEGVVVGWATRSAAEVSCPLSRRQQVLYEEFMRRPSLVGVGMDEWCRRVASNEMGSLHGTGARRSRSSRRVTTSE